MAPELFDGKKNSRKSDVYSFGIVCFEMTVHKLPWAGLNQGQIVLSIAQGKREQIPSKTTPKEFSKLIELCWNQDPKNRPSFDEIISIIEKETGKSIENPKEEIVVVK